MAWIYFQESVESGSLSSHGSEQSPIVSVTDTLSASFCPGCDQVKLIPLQSGTMSQHSEQICSHESTSSSVDSHAKISASQSKIEKAWMESEAVYSTKLSAWSKKSHPHSSFWKTCQPSELMAFSMSSAPLQKSGMIVDGLVYLPQMLEPSTSEKDGSYWRTPNANGASRGPMSLHTALTGGHQISLVTQVKHPELWPTPSSRDHKGGYQYGRVRNGKVSKDTLDAAVQAYRPGGLLNPDPTSQKSFGQLSPLWTEWLMGYPIGWTELSASVTQWFRSKSGKRSRSSQG